VSVLVDALGPLMRLVNSVVNIQRFIDFHMTDPVERQGDLQLKRETFERARVWDRREMSTHIVTFGQLRTVCFAGSEARLLSAEVAALLNEIKALEADVLESIGADVTRIKKVNDNTSGQGSVIVSSSSSSSMDCENLMASPTHSSKRQKDQDTALLKKQVLNIMHRDPRYRNLNNIAASSAPPLCGKRSAFDALLAATLDDVAKEQLLQRFVQTEEDSAVENLATSLTSDAGLSDAQCPFNLEHAKMIASEPPTSWDEKPPQHHGDGDADGWVTPSTPPELHITVGVNDETQMTDLFLKEVEPQQETADCFATDQKVENPLLLVAGAPEAVFDDDQQTLFPADQSWGSTLPPLLGTPGVKNGGSGAFAAQPTYHKNRSSPFPDADVDMSLPDRQSIKTSRPADDLAALVSLADVKVPGLTFLERLRIFIGKISKAPSFPWATFFDNPSDPDSAYFFNAETAQRVSSLEDFYADPYASIEAEVLLASHEWRRVDADHPSNTSRRPYFMNRGLSATTWNLQQWQKDH
jgi:hypothetical protein